MPSATSGVFYNQVDLQPHRSRDWLKRAPEGAADENRADVTALSLQAPPWLTAGERGLSTDAMTGIQALERPHPTIPLGPGRVERREFEYIRHGTLTLIANFAGAQGHVVASSLGPTRTEEDCMAPMARTVASAPEATRWHVVTENLNSHQSESLVRLVADRDGMKDDVGHKDKRGMLQSMATRAAFLSDPTHSRGFPYTPKHASGMNQSAMWFRILVRQWLNRASCISVADLHAKILALIAYCNATMAKPFKWTLGVNLSMSKGYVIFARLY